MNIKKLSLILILGCTSVKELDIICHKATGASSSAVLLSDPDIKAAKDGDIKYFRTIEGGTNQLDKERIRGCEVSTGRNILYFAVKYNRAELVNYAQTELNLGDIPTLASEGTLDALDIKAAKDGDFAYFEAIEGGTDQLAKQRIRDCEDSTGRNVLHFAVEAGRDRLVEYAVDKLGISNTSRDKRNNTPAHLGADRNRLETLKTLWVLLDINDKKAMVKDTDDGGANLLIWSCSPDSNSNNSKEALIQWVVKAIFEAFPRANRTIVNSIDGYASDQMLRSEVGEILDKEADWKKEYKGKEVIVKTSPLLMLINFNHFTSVKYLIEVGANPNRPLAKPIKDLPISAPLIAMIQKREFSELGIEIIKEMCSRSAAESSDPTGDIKVLQGAVAFVAESIFDSGIDSDFRKSMDTIISIMLGYCGYDVNNRTYFEARLKSFLQEVARQVVKTLREKGQAYLDEKLPVVQIPEIEKYINFVDTIDKKWKDIYNYIISVKSTSEWLNYFQGSEKQFYRHVRLSTADSKIPGQDAVSLKKPAKRFILGRWRGIRFNKIDSLSDFIMIRWIDSSRTDKELAKLFDRVNSMWPANYLGAPAGYSDRRNGYLSELQRRSNKFNWASKDLQLSSELAREGRGKLKRGESEVTLRELVQDLTNARRALVALLEYMRKSRDSTLSSDLDTSSSVSDHVDIVWRDAVQTNDPNSIQPEGNASDQTNDPSSSQSGC